VPQRAGARDPCSVIARGFTRRDHAIACPALRVRD
jgi:hypothetical protein